MKAEDKYLQKDILAEETTENDEMDLELQDWLEYQKTKSPQLREKLIIQYAPLVKYVAGKVIIGMPRKIEFEDLVGYGTFGLLDAIERFDPSRNIKFKTYAITRIRGAIFDELRSIDWVPRTVRQRVRLLDNTVLELENRLERTPTDEEIADAMHISLKDLQKLYLNMSSLTVASFDTVVSTANPGNVTNLTIGSTIETDGEEKPDYMYEKQEIRNMIVDLIKSLPEKEQQVLILYYYEDLTLKEIGKVLQVTESRISQLHTKSIVKLRAKVKKLEAQMNQSHYEKEK